MVVELQGGFDEGATLRLGWVEPLRVGGFVPVGLQVGAPYSPVADGLWKYLKSRDFFLSSFLGIPATVIECQVPINQGHSTNPPAPALYYGALRPCS